ncbi:MAG: TraR/DksA family transcriptional regulator [Saprospiraceae bacterium]|nr:TraR/DksA family transcriptional regulator [Saprospiraceae bacterium]
MAKKETKVTQAVKMRYTDQELDEFKKLIDDKMVQAKNELNDIEQQMMEMRENMADEQGGDWFDDSSIHTEIEFLTKMAERQRQFVQNLEMALVRIKNKSYGICIVTGDLIEKERLKIVPHATKSVQAKEKEAPSVHIENDRPTITFDDGPDEQPLVD